MSNGIGGFVKVLIVAAGIFSIPALLIALGYFGTNFGLFLNLPPVIGFGWTLIGWGIGLFLVCLLVVVLIAYIKSR